MPSTLEKTRKQIAKKRNGSVGALHQNSRNSKRLHRAQVRDERLDKIAATRRKQDQPLLDRASYFQAAIRGAASKPLQLDGIQELVRSFVRQYDGEYEAVKQTRRPGRGPSAKEDLLKMKMAALEKEYEDGFFMPDLSSEDNISLLDRWEGSWSYLTNLKWVRITDSGTIKASSFPPRQS